MKKRTLWIMFCHDKTALEKDQMENIEKVVWVEFLLNCIKIKCKKKKKILWSKSTLFIFSQATFLVRLCLFITSGSHVTESAFLFFLPTQHLSMVRALRNSFRPLTPSVCGSRLQFFGKYKRLILHFMPVDSRSNFPITPCDDNSNITWCISISQRKEIGQSPGLDTALRWI